MRRGVIVDELGYIQFNYTESDGIDGDPVVRSKCGKWFPLSILERHELGCRFCRRRRRTYVSD